MYNALKCKEVGISMDFQKATIIGVNFRDLKNLPASQHVFAEVVLIDRSHHELQPALYRLKNEELADEDSFTQNQGVLQLHSDVFSMVGFVEHIDKKKKQIRLSYQNTNQDVVSSNTVSYNHLIVASGINEALLGHSNDEDFSAGLTALVEALKLRKKFPSSLAHLAPRTAAAERDKHAFLSRFNPDDAVALDVIDKVVHEKMTSINPKALQTSIGSMYKRLYEVQMGT